MRLVNSSDLEALDGQKPGSKGEQVQDFCRRGRLGCAESDCRHGILKRPLIGSVTRPPVSLWFPVTVNAAAELESKHLPLNPPNRVLRVVDML